MTLPIYKDLRWSQDDDLTSVKFQQMSDNQDYLINNVLWQPQIVYQLSPSGATGGLRGRDNGTGSAFPDIATATTPISMVGIFTSYDSPVKLTDYEVIVPLPKGFTKPPIYSVSVATGTLQEIAYISADYSTTEMRVHLFYRDGVARFFAGVIHVIAIGAGTLDTTFKPVMWQQDDEITFDKLQQMNTNTVYVHDNTLLQPVIHYQVSPSAASGDTDLRGRPKGTFAASKVVGIFTAYDSTTPLVDFEVIVPIPPNVFTYPPIFSVTVATGTLQEIAYITDDYELNQMKVHLFYRDGVARMYDGVLHVIAIGY